VNAGGESCVVQGKPFFQLFESSVSVPGDCVSDCHVCHVRGAILRHDGHDSCVASLIRAPRAGNQLTCNQLANKLDFPDEASSDTLEPYRETRWRTFVAVFHAAEQLRTYKMECSWMPPTTYTSMRAGTRKKSVRDHALVPNSFGSSRMKKLGFPYSALDWQRPATNVGADTHIPTRLAKAAPIFTCLKAALMRTSYFQWNRPSLHRTQAGFVLPESRDKAEEPALLVR